MCYSWWLISCAWPQFCQPRKSYKASDLLHLGRGESILNMWHTSILTIEQWLQKYKTKSPNEAPSALFCHYWIFAKLICIIYLHIPNHQSGTIISLFPLSHPSQIVWGNRSKRNLAELGLHESSGDNSNVEEAFQNLVKNMLRNLISKGFWVLELLCCLKLLCFDIHNSLNV